MSRNHKEFWSLVGNMMYPDRCWVYMNVEMPGRYVDMNQKVWLPHRFAYCAVHKISNDELQGKFVRRTCRQRTCVNPKHLSLVRTRRPRRKTELWDVIPDEDIAGVRLMFLKWAAYSAIRRVYPALTDRMVDQTVNYEERTDVLPEKKHLCKLMYRRRLQLKGRDRHNLEAQHNQLAK